jgi:hypothetical protein
VDIIDKSSAVNSSDLNSIADYHGPEIKQLADHPHVKRVPREPEPPEEAARACEEPESRRTGRWEAPDAGVDGFPPYERGLTHGRSRG